MRANRQTPDLFKHPDVDAVVEISEGPWSAPAVLTNGGISVHITTGKVHL